MKQKNKEFLNFIKKYVIATIIIIFLIFLSYLSINNRQKSPEPFDLEPLNDFIEMVGTFYLFYIISISYFAIQTIKRVNPENAKIRYIIYTIILLIVSTFSNLMNISMYNSNTMYINLIGIILFHIILFPICIFLIMKKSKKVINIIFLVLIIIFSLRIIIPRILIYQDKVETYKYHENIDNTEPCKNILYTNDDFVYCSNSLGIKQINRKTNKVKSYNQANPLTLDDCFRNSKYFPNETKKYIYYSTYVNTSNSLDHFTITLHVIDISTGNDTLIGTYKNKILTQADLDSDGSLYYIIANDDDDEAYYYDIKNNKLTKEEPFDSYSFDLIHNKIIHYNKINRELKGLDHYTYNLKTNKTESKTFLRYDSKIDYNTAPHYYYGYLYRIDQNQINKYTINGEKLETIYGENISYYYEIYLYNKKLYLFGETNDNNYRLDYIDLEKDFTITKTDIDFDFENRKINNLIIYQDKIYYLINKEYSLYAYDMNTKEEKLINNTRFYKFETINDYYLSFDNYVIDLRDNSILEY